MVGRCVAVRKSTAVYSKQCNRAIVYSNVCAARVQTSAELERRRGPSLEFDFVIADVVSRWCARDLPSHAPPHAGGVLQWSQAQWTPRPYPEHFNPQSVYLKCTGHTVTPLCPAVWGEEKEKCKLLVLTNCPGPFPGLRRWHEHWRIPIPSPSFFCGGMRQIMAIIADFMLVWLPAPTVALSNADQKGQGNRCQGWIAAAPSNAFPGTP